MPIFMLCVLFVVGLLFVAVERVTRLNGFGIGCLGLIG